MDELVPVTDPPPALAVRPAVASPVTAYLERLAPGSRRAMRGALATLVQLAGAEYGTGDAPPERFPWWQLTHAHTAALRARAAARFAPAHANKLRCALRQVLLECRRAGLMSAQAHADAADIPRVAGTRLPAGRVLGPGEWARLVAAAGRGTPRERRDLALLCVLRGAGLRRDEAARLTRASYQRGTAELRVRGKGDRERAVPVSRALAMALDAWLADRGDGEGPLFVAMTAAGALTHRPLSVQAAYDVVRRLAARAGLESLSPHDFRRSFITELLDNAVDVIAVSRLVGHAQTDTTRRYDRRGERAGRAAVETIDLLPSEPPANDTHGA